MPARRGPGKTGSAPFEPRSQRDLELIV